MNLLSEKLSVYFVNNKLIDETDKEVFKYGFVVFCSTVGKFFIYALIFSLLGNFLEYITFAIGFCILRVYSGGYHSETFAKCFATSLLIILFGLYVSKVLYLWKMINLPLVLCTLSVAIVYKFAPGKVKNRPLTSTEYYEFRKKSRIVVLLFTFLVVVMRFCFETSVLNYIFAIAMFIQSLNIISLRSGDNEKEDVLTI